ncbi:MAG TPA: Plug domain-containing protein [Gemmatimonadales bacterium]|nr:Plug domain-containing protein [Gemmatimonadales bacterium]
MDYTARFLKAQAEQEVLLPVLPVVGVHGPRPPLTRIVFNRDSIEWGSAATVSDLLAQIPGVYLWRGGFTGRPEPVDFEGRGATSAEYELDGIPYVAAGVDSVGVDPALFSLSLLDRIEVERWPGWLRVRLFTRRHNRLSSRSSIGIGRGDREFARYEGDLERRFANGIGFALSADYLSSPTASGVSSTYSNTQFWGQGSYVPSGKFGIQYQLIRSGPNRRAFTISDVTANDTIGLGFKAKRTDAQIRMSLRARDDGLGPGVDLVYARSAWDSPGIDQQINQLGGYASFRAPTVSLGASALHRSRWTSLDLRGSAGWTPLTAFSASAEAVHQSHDGGRKSDYVALAAGLSPLRGLALTGTARLGNIVAAPAILADTAQKLRDFGATLGWDRSRLGLQVGWSRTAAFSPFAYAEFTRVASLAPTPDVDWLTLGVRVAPLQWLTVESRYADPRNATIDGVPPTHSVNTATIRSKFLRKFRSGIFDLKAQFSMESWGRGIIGRDATGAPITLRGATFYESLLEIQLQSFTLYWDRRNLQATKLAYVPGFQIPSYGSNFGVRWVFSN